MLCRFSEYGFQEFCVGGIHLGVVVHVVVGSDMNQLSVAVKHIGHIEIDGNSRCAGHPMYAINVSVSFLDAFCYFAVVAVGEYDCCEAFLYIVQMFVDTGGRELVHDFRNITWIVYADDLCQLVLAEDVLQGVGTIVNEVDRFGGRHVEFAVCQIQTTAYMRVLWNDEPSQAFPFVMVLYRIRNGTGQRILADVDVAGGSHDFGE